MSDFDTFWSRYPRRESRAAAMREYIYARRTVSAETILAGLDRYNEHLPRELRFIKKPANWLRDGDWDNEYDVPKPITESWFDECHRLHGNTCPNQLQHHQRNWRDAQKDAAS